MYQQFREFCNLIMDVLFCMFYFFHCSVMIKTVLQYFNICCNVAQWACKMNWWGKAVKYITYRGYYMVARDRNFMFEWQEQYLTSERNSLGCWLFCKFIHLNRVRKIDDFGHKQYKGFWKAGRLKCSSLTLKCCYLAFHFATGEELRTMWGLTN